VKDLSRALYQAVAPLRRKPAAGTHALDDERLLIEACERAAARVEEEPEAASRIARPLFAEVRHLVQPAFQLRAFEAIEAVLSGPREQARRQAAGRRRAPAGVGRRAA
jgi:hypothetical protein